MLLISGTHSLSSWWWRLTVLLVCQLQLLSVVTSIKTVFFGLGLCQTLRQCLPKKTCDGLVQADNETDRSSGGAAVVLA